MKQVYPSTLIHKKKHKERFCMLTAYDATMALILESANVEVILVGDSLGNVIAGAKNTVSVTMEQMILHTSYVSAVCKHALIVADMPFLSYEVCVKDAKYNAGRLLKEAGAHAVKLEVHEALIPTISALSSMGVSVMAHIGLTPQSVYQQGGFKLQGTDASSFERLISLAKACEGAGAFSIVLECVPDELAQTITASVSIPTIGIGAGPFCDAQVLVSHDVLGLSSGRVPSFVKSYGQFFEPMSESVSRFREDVILGRFPQARDEG